MIWCSSWYSPPTSFCQDQCASNAARCDNHKIKAEYGSGLTNSDLQKAVQCQTNLIALQSELAEKGTDVLESQFNNALLTCKSHCYDALTNASSDNKADDPTVDALCFEVTPIWNAWTLSATDVNNMSEFELFVQPAR